MDQNDMIRYARDEYVRGEIELSEFERAVWHILHGGAGCEEFPYLPIFAVPGPVDIGNGVLFHPGGMQTWSMMMKGMARPRPDRLRRVRR